MATEIKQNFRGMFLALVGLAALLVFCVVVFLHSTVSAQNTKPATILFEGATDLSRFDSTGIYSVNSDGTNLKRLTTDGDRIFSSSPHPQWSPDGQHIAYVSWPQGLSGGSVAAELYVMDREGGNRDLLMNVTEKWGQRTQQITGFAWSPDGESLAVTKLVSGLLWVPANGKGDTRLVLQAQSGRDFSSPAWSPDGKRIAFYAYTPPAGNEFSQTLEIHVVNADGSADRTVGTSVVQSRLVLQAVPTRWSADGGKVFFPLLVSTAPGNVAVREYWSNAEGSGEMQWTGGPAYPEVSADGKRIAFAKAQPGGTKEIFVMNEDGSNIHQVTNDPDWACPTSSWLPDGKRLVVSCNFVRDKCQMAIGCNWRIFLIAADGTSTKLAPIIDRDARYPSVSPKL